MNVDSKSSKRMAAIRAKDTKPEIIVRKYLWSHGFRYRLNHSDKYKADDMELWSRFEVML